MSDDKTALPRRVRVWDGSGENAIGDGTYVGDVAVFVIVQGEGESMTILSNRVAEEEPDPATVPEGCKVEALGSNPKIEMDDGTVRYGCQVWWKALYSPEEMVNRAMQVMDSSHARQQDKQGVNYLWHPVRVALAFIDDPVRAQVALLHDVVEDGGVSLEDLRRLGFDKAVVEAVDAISRRSGESYDDYLVRVAANTVATFVKLVDIADNRERMTPELSATGLLGRYLKAEEVLRFVQATLQEKTDHADAPHQEG